MKMNKKTASRFGAAALVIGLSVAGYIVIDQMGARPGAGGRGSAGAIPVTVATAEKKDVPIIVRGIGTVQAYNTAVIKTRVDGAIVKVVLPRKARTSRRAICSSRSTRGRSRRRSTRRRPPSDATRRSSSAPSSTSIATAS